MAREAFRSVFSAAICFHGLGLKKTNQKKQKNNTGMEREIYGKERCQHLQKVNVVLLHTAIPV